MATVYLAWDEKLEAERAIKVLAPGLSHHDSLRRRFVSEAQTMAKLRHRNVVTVHDYAIEGARVYLVMELLDGGSLMDRLKAGGPLPPREAIAAMERVLLALEMAHRMGVVHRDIKPQNILLDAEGQPHVTDFGIARVADRKDSLTKTGSAMGTWAFMSPEQQLSAKEVDARADLYSAGATLYVLLTDREPMGLFATERHEELFVGLPEALVEVIACATRYRPEDRYASADAMREALFAAAGAMDEETLGHSLPAPPSSETPADAPPDAREAPSRDTWSPTLEPSASSPGAVKSLSEGSPTELPESVDAPTPAPLAPPPSGRGRFLGAPAVGLVAVLAVVAFWGSGDDAEPPPDALEVAVLPSPVAEHEAAPPATTADAEPSEASRPAPTGPLEVIFSGDAAWAVSLECASGKAERLSFVAGAAVFDDVPVDDTCTIQFRGGAPGSYGPLHGDQAVRCTYDEGASVYACGDPAAELAPPVEEPAPSPVPLVEPPPAEAVPVEPAPASGTLVVTAEGAKSVWAIDAANQRHVPGALAAGTYRVQANYDGRSTAPSPPIVLSAGQVVQVICRERYAKCQVQP